MVEPRDPSGPHGEPTRMPLWVKVFGTALAAAILLVVVLLLVGGDHGPGRHLP